MFTFPPQIPKTVYTTNALESLHRSLRTIIKTRSSFPSDEAAPLQQAPSRPHLLATAIMSTGSTCPENVSTGAGYKLQETCIPVASAMNAVTPSEATNPFTETTEGPVSASALASTPYTAVLFSIKSTPVWTRS